MILSVYGRFFKMYMYTAIAPIPLSSFAGAKPKHWQEFSQSYAAVCLRARSSCSPVSSSRCLRQVHPWLTRARGSVDGVSYIGELIFNMLILVGSVKMADRIVREMMGL